MQNTAKLAMFQFSPHVGCYTQTDGNSFGFTIAGCSLVDSEQTTVYPTIRPCLGGAGEPGGLEGSNFSTGVTLVEEKALRLRVLTQDGRARAVVVDQSGTNISSIL